MDRSFEKTTRKRKPDENRTQKIVLTFRVKIEFGFISFAVCACENRVTLIGRRSLKPAWESVSQKASAPRLFPAYAFTDPARSTKPTGRKFRRSAGIAGQSSTKMVYRRNRDLLLAPSPNWLTQCWRRTARRLPRWLWEKVPEHNAPASNQNGESHAQRQYQYGCNGRPAIPQSDPDRPSDDPESHQFGLESRHRERQWRRLRHRAEHARQRGRLCSRQRQLEPRCFDRGCGDFRRSVHFRSFERTERQSAGRRRYVARHGKPQRPQRRFHRAARSDHHDRSERVLQRHQSGGRLDGQFPGAGIR